MLLSASTVAALMLWASQLSGLPMPSDSRQPTITYSHELPKRAGAWTYRSSGNIEINAKADWSNPHDFTCTVVHELVHYLQVRSAAPDPWEPAAYHAMADCYAAYGERGAYHWAMWQAEEHKDD